MKVLNYRILHSAKVRDWKYEDGIFTGRIADEDKSYPRGCGWRFRTNIAPGRSGGGNSPIPFLRELIQEYNKNPISEDDDAQFIAVDGQEGMKAVLEDHIPFIEAHLERE